ncbi:MAG: EutN/CcmL family microcompartment protein [Deltaproteobacteria bacterium]|nr:EutN/CcmL family microcompartment protein [Deltaproteobacteria bacterium]
MFLARVIGTVVASVKTPGLDGIKLLVVEPLDSAGKSSGAPLVACDRAQAGPGDHVFCVDKREATHAMPDPFVPVDAAIVGIVDIVSGGRS